MSPERNRWVSRVRSGVAVLAILACGAFGEERPDVGLTSGGWDLGRGATLNSGQMEILMSGEKPAAADAWMKQPLEGDFTIEVDYVIDRRDATVISSGIGIRIDPVDGTGALLIDRSKRGSDEEYRFGLPAAEKSKSIERPGSSGSFRLARSGASFALYFRDEANADWTLLGNVATKFPAKVNLGLTAHKVGKGEFRATVKRVARGVADPGAGKRVRIGAAGGTIELEGCTLEFPKDAFGKDVEIGIAPVSDPPSPNFKNLRLISGFFTVTTTQARLAEPVRVTMKFDPARLRAGSKPEDIVPVIGRGGDYEEMRAESVDMAKGEITFQLRRLEPRIAHEGPAAGGSSQFGVAGYIDRLPVLHQEEGFSLSAPADLPDAAANIDAVRETLVHSRKELESRGFVKVKWKLQIGLVPADWITGNAGYTGGEYLIYVDKSLCGTGDTFKAVLAHEFFHIVQNNSWAAYDSNQNTQVNASWLTESSAEWFAQSVYPRGHIALDRIGSMTTEFFNAPFFHGAEFSLHHYQSYTFYSFLDPQHGAHGLIRAFYLNPDKEPKKEPTLDTVALLEAALVDRGTSLPDVFTDFIIHAAWKKDREPFRTVLSTPELERYAKPLVEQLGGPGEIKSDPSRLETASIPFTEKGARVRAKRFGTVVAEPYGIARTYDISSGTEGSEKGDLTLTLTGCPEGMARVVAFPRTEAGLSDPVIGKSGTATIRDWHTLKGAIVWVVSVTNEQRHELRLEARLGNSFDLPPGGREFVLKGGRPTITNSSATADLGPGWNASASSISRSLEIMVGPIGELKPKQVSAKLSIQGPPDTLKEGQEVELSLSVAGDREADIMGEWLISGADGKPEGVDCVGLESPDSRSPRPNSGKLKFKVAKSPYDFGPTITLTGHKWVRIEWKYELKSK